MGRVGAAAGDGARRLASAPLARIALIARSSPSSFSRAAGAAAAISAVLASGRIGLAKPPGRILNEHPPGRSLVQPRGRARGRRLDRIGAEVRLTGVMAIAQRPPIAFAAKNGEAGHAPELTGRDWRRPRRSPADGRPPERRLDRGPGSGSGVVR
jgi:hypothetical protein